MSSKPPPDESNAYLEQANHYAAGDESAPPDTFNPNLESSRAEIYAYYAYNAGNNSLSSSVYAPIALQRLLARAIGEKGVIEFAGQPRDVSSVMLICDGASFALTTFFLLFMGSYADYSNFRSRILIFWSFVAFGIGFSWLGVHTPEKWGFAAVLYILGLTAYQLSLTYWTAAFPSLARNVPQLRNAGIALANGKISREDYDAEDTKHRSRISNGAYIHQSWVLVFLLGVIVLIIKGSGLEENNANASRCLSIIVSFSTSVWLLLAIPWFILEKKRPGAAPPDGVGIIRAGLKKLYIAATNIWALKQTLIYLFCYYLLCQTLNTSFTLFTTLEHQILDYNPLTLTYLVMLGVAFQGAGVYTYSRLQESLKLSTKSMVTLCIASIVMLAGWGMIGNWTRAFGYHNVWETWAWQAVFGFSVCPWYSYSKIMISTVTPRGYESMFFSLFGIIGTTSSFVGPFMGSIIIDLAHGENRDWSPFYALFATGLVGGGIFWLFLDEGKSAAEQKRFLEQREALPGPASNIELDNLLSPSLSEDLEST